MLIWEHSWGHWYFAFPVCFMLPKKMNTTLSWGLSTKGTKVIWWEHLWSSTRKCCKLASSMELYPASRFDEGWAGSVNAVQLADALFTKLENCIITAGTRRTYEFAFYGELCRKAMLRAHEDCFWLWLLTDEHTALPWSDVCGCCVSSCSLPLLSPLFFFFIQPINFTSVSTACSQHWAISCAECLGLKEVV